MAERSGVRFWYSRGDRVPGVSVPQAGRYNCLRVPGPPGSTADDLSLIPATSILVPLPLLEEKFPCHQWLQHH